VRCQTGPVPKSARGLREQGQQDRPKTGGEEEVEKRCQDPSIFRVLTRMGVVPGPTHRGVSQAPPPRRGLFVSGGFLCDRRGGGDADGESPNRVWNRTTLTTKDIPMNRHPLNCCGLLACGVAAALGLLVAAPGTAPAQ